MCDYRTRWNRAKQVVHRHLQRCGKPDQLKGIDAPGSGLDLRDHRPVKPRLNPQLFLSQASREPGFPHPVADIGPLNAVAHVLSRRAGVIAEDNDTEVTRESGRLEMALVAWLREVRQLIELGVMSPRPLIRAEHSVDSAGSARAVALWLRQQLGSGLAPIESMQELCERAGQYVLVADIPGDGASVLDGDVAAAVVSLRGDPGRRRATAAHELGHLVIGDEYSSDLGVHASRADREAAIDAFAAEFLLPSQVVAEARGGSATSSGISREQLIGIAARYRTSWPMAIRQADHAGVLSAQARREWSRCPAAFPVRT